MAVTSAPAAEPAVRDAAAGMEPAMAPAMAPATDRVLVFDTTLRDGEQAPGCSLTRAEKLAIAHQLAALRVDIIEAGFPAASDGEADAVRAIADEIRGPGQPVICALARAAMHDIEICARALGAAPRRRIHTFIATSDLHIQHKLRLTHSEVIVRAREAVQLARTFTPDVEFSPEDATRSDPAYLEEVLHAAIEAGATTLNIPDTVGYATPEEYAALIARVCRLAAAYPNVIVSTHCHDDLGLAVANSLAGVRAGARQVECTINGLGERAGNASLEEVVMALRTRPRVFGCHTTLATTELARSSRLVSEATGVPVPANKAIVGANAFAHESGIHQDGMLKHRTTYEIMTPESVGVDCSRLVLGKHSGRRAVGHHLERLGYTVSDTALALVADRVKAACDDGRTIDDTLLRTIVDVVNAAAGASAADAPAAATSVASESATEGSPASDASETTAPPAPRTLLDRIWDAHVVIPADESTPARLYVDLHLVHEVTSAQAFAQLDRRGLRVRNPGRTLATMDHSTPTTPARNGRAALPVADPAAQAQLNTLAANCARHGVPLYPLGHDRQGIVHVIGPELGLTQPGMTIACGDSHTSTHGAFGALAFGIGTSQVAHVMATQCVFYHKPKAMRIRVDGTLAPGVSAKDVILAIIARIGVNGATGHVIEYCGSTIEALSMEERMTICNMSIEAGARAGMIAPDDTTFAYLTDRLHAPRGAAWEEAVARWRTLRSDSDAVFDAEIVIDASALEPMITFGTNPGMGIPVSGAIPRPEAHETAQDRAMLTRALEYMALQAGRPIAGTPINTVFLGSCTNSRLTDLRAAASVLRGARVADGVRMLVVPGSRAVKRAAEAEGLDRVFRDAGAEWREAGCSMCLAMNGDQLGPGELAVSTSNRNFEGRQGPGGRTLLASPVTAAACAIAGVVADPRHYLTASVH